MLGSMPRVGLLIVSSLLISVCRIYRGERSLRGISFASVSTATGMQIAKGVGRISAIPRGTLALPYSTHLRWLLRPAGTRHR
jgi:hypothetical protein